MTYPAWVKIEGDELVFKARLIGFDGGNTVVGTPQGGVYIGLPTKNITWEGPLPGAPCVPGHVGFLSVPKWVAKFHRQLVLDKA